MANDFALVTNGDDYALYVLSRGDDGRWNLADSGTDAKGNAQRMARVLMQNTGGSGSTHEGMLHLIVAGAWRQIITEEDLKPPTPRMIVEAEIATLSAHGATEGREDLLERAEGMQRALDILYPED